MRGKQDVLDKIQKAGNVTTKDKEAALSAFYYQWTVHEATRQADYTTEWNKRNRAVIRLTMRREFRIWKNSLLDAFIGHCR
jgi:apoptogenic protein 1